MEKFFIVTNEKFLKEVEDFWENEKIRNNLIKDFFESKGIYGTGYYIGGDGFCNVPFENNKKNDIRLYVDDNAENEEKFGKQLLKRRQFGNSYLRRFRKNSAILKEFQNICVERKIVINNHFHREGDWFKELCYGGYSVSRFELDGKYYLMVETHHNGITPIEDGFKEIKGSEFYQAKEKFEERVKCDE